MYVLQPSGRLDAAQAPIFRRTVLDLVSNGETSILVDLQNVNFVDSSGLGALVAALKRTREVGGKLYLCAVNDQIKTVLELTSMDRVFTIFPDRATCEKAV